MALSGRHVPALDGLRGVAVLLVMLFHFNMGVEDEYRFDSPLLAPIQAGWCGVDLFFVLSGFLITGILLDAKGSSRYFRNFYVRRALRIFPLYYAVLLAVFFVAPAVTFLLTTGYRELAHNQLPLWAYYSNIAIAVRESFYFRAEWVSLNHFWSLAIEEQFYLVWPAVVLLCRRRTLVAVCLACMAGAFALRAGLVFQGGYKYTPYVFTLCRLDGLTFGSLLAVGWRAPGWRPALVRAAWPLGLACGVGLVGVWAATGGFSSYDPLVQTAGYSLLALFFGAGLLLAVNAGTAGIAGRTLRSPVLSFFGKYSYGLYVVHPNVRDVLQHLFPIRSIAVWVNAPALAAVVFVGLAFSVSVALAWLSWHLYEKHFLKLKAYFEYARQSKTDLARSKPARGELPAAEQCLVG
jgi:peptidoglycan/LPS O-acetylase OafA/YrhL